MIGGLQTQEALKLIHGMPVDSGEALVFNGNANNFYKTKFQHREDCLSHETYPQPVELELSNAATARELFAAVKEHFPSDSAAPAELFLHLDRDLVVSVHCSECDLDRPIMRPQ